MPKTLVPRAELMDKLADLFRAGGYEAASLNTIAAAVGLEKASLYHRFPGGKEEMAVAVMEHVGNQFEAGMFADLRGPGSRASRARKAAAFLREYYADGSKPCALDTLSLPAGGESLRRRVQATGIAVQSAFEAFLREGGQTRPVARAHAQRLLIELEGSLVYARAVGDAEPFRRWIKQLPAALCVSA